jgi:hypothetical protein
MTSPEVESLCNQVAQLESVLRGLRTRYTEEHPRIWVVKNRIDELLNTWLYGFSFSCHPPTLKPPTLEARSLTARSG